MAQSDDGTVKLQEPPASSLSSLMESNEDHAVELVDAIATLFQSRHLCLHLP